MIGSLCRTRGYVRGMEFNTTTCPVCGMEIEQDKAPASAPYDDQTYYFCSTGCHDAFVADPGRYVGNTGS